MDTWQLMDELGDSANPARVLRVIKIPAPAVATSPSFTVPGQSIWRPISFVTSLVTDANVAARQAALAISDGTDTLALLLAGQSIAASLTTTLSFFGAGANAQGAAGAAILTGPMPDVVLMPGFTLGLSTAAIQAGDQYGSSLLWVEEYLEQPFGAKQERLLNWLEHLASTSLAAEGSN